IASSAVGQPPYMAQLMHGLCHCPSNEHRSSASASQTRCRENCGTARARGLTEYEIELRHKKIDRSDSKPDSTVGAAKNRKSIQECGGPILPTLVRVGIRRHRLRRADRCFHTEALPDCSPDGVNQVTVDFTKWMDDYVSRHFNKAKSSSGIFAAPAKI